MRQNWCVQFYLLNHDHFYCVNDIETTLLETKLWSFSAKKWLNSARILNAVQFLIYYTVPLCTTTVPYRTRVYFHQFFITVMCSTLSPYVLLYYLYFLSQEPIRNAEWKPINIGFFYHDSILILHFYIYCVYGKKRQIGKLMEYN